MVPGVSLASGLMVIGVKRPKKVLEGKRIVYAGYCKYNQLYLSWPLSGSILH